MIIWISIIWKLHMFFYMARWYTKICIIKSFFRIVKHGFDTYPIFFMFNPFNQMIEESFGFWLYYNTSNILFNESKMIFFIVCLIKCISINWIMEEWYLFYSNSSKYDIGLNLFLVFLNLVMGFFDF